MKSVLVLVGLLMLPSCVTKARYKRDIDTVAEAAKTAIVLAKAGAAAECASKMIEKDERLRKFNQLNEDGTLR